MGGGGVTLSSVLGALHGGIADMESMEAGKGSGQGPTEHVWEQVAHSLSCYVEQVLECLSSDVGGSVLGWVLEISSWDHRPAHYRSVLW